MACQGRNCNFFSQVVGVGLGWSGGGELIVRLLISVNDYTFCHKVIILFQLASMITVFW